MRINDRRTSKASLTFRSLYRVVWYRKRLKIETKLHLFKAVVLPTPLYGSETWVPLETPSSLHHGASECDFWECHYGIK